MIGMGIRKSVWAKEPAHIERDGLNKLSSLFP